MLCRVACGLVLGGMAGSVLADPFAQFSILGKKDGSADAFSSTVSNVAPGDVIDYEIVLRALTSVGANFSNATLPAHYQIKAGDGISSIASFGLFQSASTGVAFSFDNPAEGTVSTFYPNGVGGGIISGGFDMGPGVYGGGQMARGNTGFFDLQGVRLVQRTSVQILPQTDLVVLSGTFTVKTANTGGTARLDGDITGLLPDGTSGATSSGLKIGGGLFTPNATISDGTLNTTTGVRTLPIGSDPPFTWNALTLTASGSPPPPGYVWNGTTSDWQTPGNWDNTIPGAGKIAIFSDSGASATVNLATDGTVGGLIFNDSVPNTTIQSTGGKLILNNGTAPVVIDVTGSHTIIAPITGTTPLNKTGTGTLTLGGSNTVSSSLSVEGGGTLNLTGSNAFSKGDFNVGSTSAGNTLNVTDGGDLLSSTSNTLNVGKGTFGDNHVNISAPGNAANPSFKAHNFFLGVSSSDNTVTISNGAYYRLVSGNSTWKIGQNAGATNNVLEVTGANSILDRRAANGSAIQVGDAGDHNLVKAGDGGAIYPRRWILGANGGFNNSVLITDPGSYTQINEGSNSIFEVGSAAGAHDNSFTIANGATSYLGGTGTTRDFSVGKVAGADNNVLAVTDAGSKLTIRYPDLPLAIGGLATGKTATDGGAGNHLDVYSGGELNSNTSIYLLGANSAFNLGDGTGISTATVGAASCPPAANQNGCKKQPRPVTPPFASGIYLKNASDELNFNSGRLIAGANGALVSGKGSINLDGDAYISTTWSGSTISNVISGGGSLTKEGSGVLILSGASTYTGDTIINAGILRTSGANRLPAGSAVTLASGASATLDLHGNNQTIASLSGGGTVLLGSGTLTVGDDSTATFNGKISGSGGLNKTGGGTLTLTGNNTVNGLSVDGGGTLTLTGNNTVNGLSVDGGGTLNLAGNNAFTSATNIGGSSAGNTLNVTGRLTGSTPAGNFYVGNGAFGDNHVNISGAGTPAKPTVLIGGNSVALWVGGNRAATSNNSVTISNGAYFRNNGGNGTTNSWLGANAGSNNNSFTVTGANSTFSNSGQRFYVGGAGNNNTLAVNQGGQMLLRVLHVGSTTATPSTGGSNNAATVDGPGSLLSVSEDMFIGDAAGSSGNSVTVSGGASLTSQTRNGKVELSTIIGTDTGANNNSLTITGSGSQWVDSGYPVLVGGTRYTTGTTYKWKDAQGNSINIASGGLATINTGVILAGTNSSFNLGDGNSISSATVGSGGKISGISLSVADALLNLNSGRLTAGATGALVSGPGQVNLLGAAYIASSNSNSVDSVISGVGGLTKEGTGRLTLSRANTYTGGTILSSGTLVAANGATGSATGTGAVTLNGGILAGCPAGGHIAGPVQPGSGPHTIAPGAGLAAKTFGTLTLDAGLTTSSNTTLAFTLGTPLSGSLYTGDILNVNNGLTLGAGTKMTFSYGSAFKIGDTFRLIGGSFGTPDLSNIILPATGDPGKAFTLSTTADPGWIDLQIASSSSPANRKVAASPKAIVPEAIPVALISNAITAAPMNSADTTFTATAPTQADQILGTLANSLSGQINTLAQVTALDLAADPAAILADSGTSLRSSMLLSSPRMSAQFGSGPQAQSVVPEPTSLGLVGLSAIGMLIRRRRVGR